MGKLQGWRVRVFGGLLLTLLLLPLSVYAYYHLPYDHQAREVRFRVRKGENFQEISRGLSEQKLIRFHRTFALLARLQGLDKNVRAGEYLFDSSWDPAKILDALSLGKVLLRKVTIPEGATAKQISFLLEKSGLADHLEIQQAQKDPELIRELGLEGDSLEGYLFPDTYHFSEGLPPKAILKSMVERFWEVFGPEMREQQKLRGLTVREMVTIASIVEKETAFGEEKPRIASVIYNRLQKKMPLQCDPTVIYGIEDFDGNLTRCQLETPHPYNTYVNPGLPPGPIANPGLESLRAVLAPEQTSYLYFVSRNDGTHYFSTDLEEHGRAVQEYQMRKK
jgi:UPF0755 protein